METLYAALAAITVLAHLAFVAFAAAGALLVARRPKLAWLHVPAMSWAVFIELSAGICPLTPVENIFRAHAGLDDYSGDFVAHYLFPVLYPAGLTRGAQLGIGGALLAANAGIYGWIVARRQRRTRPGPGPSA